MDFLFLVHSQLPTTDFYQVMGSKMVAALAIVFMLLFVHGMPERVGEKDQRSNL